MDVVSNKLSREFNFGVGHRVRGAVAWQELVFVFFSATESVVAVAWQGPVSFCYLSWFERTLSDLVICQHKNYTWRSPDANLRKQMQNTVGRHKILEAENQKS